MAEPTTEPKIEASSEPELEKSETELATNPIQDEGAKDESAEESSVCLRIYNSTI